MQNNLLESKRKAIVSVPVDPFTSVSSILATQTQSPFLSSSSEMFTDIAEGSTIVESSFIAQSSSITESPSFTVNKVTDDSLVMKVNDKVGIEKLVEIETSDTMSEDELFSWTRFAEQVTVFLVNFERASDILTNIKTTAVPNSKMFVIEIIDCLSKIQKECGDLLHYVKKKRKRNIGRK